jgi:hypothetical protein
MKTKLSVLAAALSVAVIAKAGPMEVDSKEMVAAPKITESEPWHFDIGVPGWLPGVYGDMGVHDVSTGVSVDFDQILKHIKGAASFSAEVRKGRWGFYADILYLGANEGLYSDGLLSKVNIDLSQYLVDSEVFYRILDGPRGSLDLRAGGRYMNIYTGTQLIGSNSVINQASVDLANAIAGDLRGVLERFLKGRLDGTNPPLPVPPLTGDVKRELIRAIIAARQNPVTAQQNIARILHKQLNRTFSLTERWADPYLGLGGHYNLTKVFYLTGKGDVGGFGVGSQITAQGYAAVGCHVTRDIYAEAGYRILYYDYDSDGFLFKAATRGAQVTVGIAF